MTETREDQVSRMIAMQMDNMNEIFNASTALQTSYSILFSAVIDSGLTRENEEAELFAKEAIQKLFLYGFYVFAVSRKRKAEDAYQFVGINHKYVNLMYQSPTLFLHTNQKNHPRL